MIVLGILRSYLRCGIYVFNEKMHTDTVGNTEDIDDDDDNLDTELHRRCLQTRALPGAPRHLKERQQQERE